MSNFRRSGDVNLHPVSKKEQKEIRAKGKIIPSDGSYIMARGEVTGSKHILAVSNPSQLIVREYEGKMYYEVLSLGTASHTHDHETVNVEPDFYVQVPEREIDNFSHVVRKVVD